MKNESMKLRIVIADDHPLLLRGLKYSLLSEDDIEILGEAKDGQAALNMIKDFTPDIAVLDYDMPVYNGLQVLQAILKEKSTTKVIFLTMHQDSDVFKKAVSLGANGFLLKDSIDSEIIKAIRIVENGGKYFDPMLSGNLIHEKIVDKHTDSVFNKLTKTEITVLKLVADNNTTNDIATQLFISERTVDRHRSNICKKLNISGNNALMHFVIENRELLK